MYYTVYNLLLFAGTVLFLPVILFKLATVPKYRGGISQKLGWVRRDVMDVIGGGRPIWVHAVSVGEVMAVHPLVRELKKKYPRRKLIISTVTITGNYTARQRVPEADAVFFFPFDYPFVVRRVLQKINPAMVLVAETELWPNFFRELKRAGIPSAVINGRISPHSFKNYVKLKDFSSQVFEQVDLFCMQSEDDAERIRTIGAAADRVLVTGNLKFDQKLTEPQGHPVAIPKGTQGHHGREHASRRGRGAPRGVLATEG